MSTRAGAIMETGDLNGMAGLLPVSGQAEQLHHQQADGVQSVEVSSHLIKSVGVKLYCTMCLKNILTVFACMIVSGKLFKSDRIERLNSENLDCSTWLAFSSLSSDKQARFVIMLLLVPNCSSALPCCNTIS